VIIELRQYTLHPGKRDVLIELFHREFVVPQEAAGMRILGTFRDLDDPDRFVWFRAFPDMVRRKESLERFYGGPVWKAHRDAANATMIDSDNVLLLREVDERYPFPAELDTVTIYEAGPIGEVARPLLRSEHAENTFPALPVRVDEDVIVAFGDRALDLPVQQQLRVKSSRG